MNIPSFTETSRTIPHNCGMKLAHLSFLGYVYPDCIAYENSLSSSHISSVIENVVSNTQFNEFCCKK